MTQLYGTHVSPFLTLLNVALVILSVAAVILLSASGSRADECEDYSLATVTVDAMQQEWRKHVKQLPTVNSNTVEEVQSHRAEMSRLFVMRKKANNLERDARQAVIASFNGTAAAAMLSAMIRAYEESVQAYITFEQWRDAADLDSEVLNNEAGLLAYVTVLELTDASLNALVTAINLACASRRGSN